MKKYDDLYNPKKKKKGILLLDTNKEDFNYFDDTDDINQSNNNQKKALKKMRTKKLYHKKFQLLRNFASNFNDDLLYLESPNKSIFAKRILSEIIPQNKQNKSKNIINYKKKYYETEHDLVILNTPKANNSFYSHKILNEPKSFSKYLMLKKRFSHSVNISFPNFFNRKKSKSSKNIPVYNLSNITDPNGSKIINENKYRGSYIHDIIEEDKNMDNNFYEYKKSNSQKKPIKINLRKAPLFRPKKLNFKNIKPKKEESKNISNYKDKISKIPKPYSKQKSFSKKCDMKKHYIHEKFISKFLTPINQFIKNDFQITNKEYENINKRIHNLNYLINNNDYSIFINRKKKAKYKDFSSPKIPDVYKTIEKKYFSKYFSILNEIKNNKFNYEKSI